MAVLLEQQNEIMSIGVKILNITFNLITSLGLNIDAIIVISKLPMVTQSLTFKIKRSCFLSKLIKILMTYL